MNLCIVVYNYKLLFIILMLYRKDKCVNYKLMCLLLLFLLLLFTTLVYYTYTMPTGPCKIHTLMRYTYSCMWPIGYYFTFSIYSCISRAIPDYSCILSTQNDGISVSHNYNLNQSTQSHADASWDSVFEWFVMHYHMKSVQ